MPNDKYFGDHITADMKVALKWLNTKLKKRIRNINLQNQIVQ